MAAFSASDVVALAAAIKAQVETSLSNNILCEELCRRAETLSASMAPLERKGAVPPALLNRLKSALEQCQKFVNKFSEKHWLQHFVSAGKYQAEFLRVNNALTEAGHDVKLILQAQQQDESLKQMQMILDAIQYTHESMLRRFELMLPEMLLSNASNIDELLDINNEDVCNLLHTAIQDKPNMRRALQITLDTLRKDRSKNELGFSRKASQSIANALCCSESQLVTANVVIDWSTQIGQGSFGVVYSGRYTDKGSTLDVAVKALERNDEMEKSFARELYILRRLDGHKNIVKLYGWLDVTNASNLKNYRCLVTVKYVMTLHSAINDFNYTPPNSIWLKYLHQVALGMSHLANAGVYHRDLKPENVLLTANEDAVISDFGMSVTKSSLMQTSISAHVTAGTMGFIAPELLGPTPNFSELSDVYSFGVLMSYTLHRGHVWLDTSQRPLSAPLIVSACQSRPPLLPTRESHSWLSNNMIYINKQCVSINAMLRPRFEQIVIVMNTTTVDSSNNASEVGGNALTNMSSQSSRKQSDVYCGAGNNIMISNVTSGVCERTLTGHSGNVNSLCALHDGRLCSGSKDNTIKVWNISSGACEMTLTGHTDSVTSLCVLPDGRLCSGSVTVKIASRHEFVPSLGRRYNIAVKYYPEPSPNIKVWNMLLGLCEMTLTGHKGGVWSLCMLPDGRLCSGSDDKTIRVWNMSSGACERILTGHTDSVTSLCVLHDGRLCSGSKDNTIKVWSGPREMTLTGHTDSVTSLCVLPDGRLCSGGGSKDKTIKVWNMTSGACMITREHADAVSSLCVLRDGRLCSGSADKSVRIWNMKSVACEQSLTFNNAVHVVYPERLPEKLPERPTSTSRKQPDKLPDTSRCSHPRGCGIS